MSFARRTTLGRSALVAVALIASCGGSPARDGRRSALHLTGDSDVPTGDLPAVLRIKEEVFPAWGTSLVLGTSVALHTADMDLTEHVRWNVGDGVDSVRTHVTTIHRLDRGVVWTVDWLDSTWRECDVASLQEAGLQQPSAWDFGIRLERIGRDRRETVAGLETTHHRLRVIATGLDTMAVADFWTRDTLPGAGLDDVFAGRYLDVVAAQHGPPPDTTRRHHGWSLDGMGDAVVKQVMRLASRDDAAKARGPALLDSVNDAWGLQRGSSRWQGERVVTSRIVRTSAAVFELPAGLRQREWTDEDDHPVAKVQRARAERARRRARGLSGPPSLSGAGYVTALRPTTMHPEPRAASGPSRSVDPAHNLYPIELEATDGFYHVALSGEGERAEGWVPATDVGAPVPGRRHDVIVSREHLIHELTLGLETEGKLSSVHIDSNRVVAIVGAGWDRNSDTDVRQFGMALAYMATGGRGTATVVFRDSVRSRDVGRFPQTDDR